MIESKSISKVKLLKIHSNGKNEEATDFIAIEEPLEIRVEYGKIENRQTANLTVTMRTPGCDDELAAGFLFSEGIIDNFDEIDSIAHINNFNSFENIILVKLKENVNFNLNKTERHFYTNSSCGVCGKTSIDAIKQVKKTNHKSIDNLKIDKEIFYTLPTKLLEKQSIFENTGGLHASALFDCNGNLITIKEDVGRHNALDKLLGYCLKNKLMPLDKYIILLSGRASFELIQKAALADAKIIASIGAPSSLAIQTAIEFDISYLGFLSSSKFNIYTAIHRIKS
ncbi:MAG: formate dehydrogenase accessory sulfurtransferase FdhD [Bacteroidetes bacterium]|nr:formate dehydrogenase accessory sulfurtransferase FdhD [Bacteroidota bacterium]